jgi:hypothetical protein
VRVFGRKKKDEAALAEASDDGIVGLYFAMVDKSEEEFLKFVGEHLERVHEPGGLDREKKLSDFMELGMRRTYLAALDDLEFSVVEGVAIPALRGRSRGKAQVVTRWTVRGKQNRPLFGILPTGEEVSIDGVTLSSFRDYRLRVEYTYWELPELTGRVLER